MLYLALSVIWATVAVGLFTYYAMRQPGQTTLWLGGLAVLMALYDLVRWWGWRTLRNQRRDLDRGRLHHRPLHRPGDDREPDPTFRFTEQPAEPPPGAPDGAGEPGAK